MVPVAEAIHDAEAIPNPPQRHVPALDGLRTLAVVAVLFHHAGFPFLGKLGFLGVDLFFVLSGFLITTLLLDEQERKGAIRLDLFWVRRFLRLMPAYLLYAAFVTASIFVFHWGEVRPGRIEGWNVNDMVVAMWLYFINYLPTLDLWSNSGLIMHLWSLAVEEQFYLIWPPIFALALRLRSALWVGWGLVAAIAINRLFYTESKHIQFYLDARGIGIILGCASAITARRLGADARDRFLGARWVRPATIGLAAALYLAGCLAISRDLISWMTFYRYWTLAFDVLFVLLIVSLYYGPLDRVGRWLSAGPMVYIGKISYGVYLYHMLSHALVWHYLLRSMDGWPIYPKYLIRLTAFMALSVGIAALSFQVLEKPFLSLKRRFR